MGTMGRIIITDLPPPMLPLIIGQATRLSLLAEPSTSIILYQLRTSRQWGLMSF